MNAELLRQVDATVLTTCSSRWQKTAMVIAKSAESLRPTSELVTFELLANRISALAKLGKLEVAGDLDEWRFSEVRLPGTPSD